MSGYVNIGRDGVWTTVANSNPNYKLPVGYSSDKKEHPYSYKEIVVFQSEIPEDDTTSTIYSDRIYQQNGKLHDQLCKKYWDNTHQNWWDRSPMSISEFLSEFIGRKVVVVKVWEYCNPSSGYPVWRFDFNSIK